MEDKKTTKGGTAMESKTATENTKTMADKKTKTTSYSTTK